MAEGTNVGSVYLDLVVRDTVEKQIRAIAAKAQAQAQQAFAGIEKIITDAAARAVSQASKSAQNAAGNMDKAVHKIVNSAASAGKQMGASFDGAFDKTVANAQARVNELTRALDAVTAKLDAQWNSGTFDAGSKATKSLLAQQEKLLARLEAAEERLTINKQAAAQKAALIADQQAAKQQAAMERSAAAAERANARREAAEQKNAIATERAAQKAADAEERAANRRKAIQASLWKNMLAAAGSMAKTITGKLLNIGKGFSSVGKTASRFGSRLREIVSGALIFNGISAAVRKVTEYFGEAVSSSSEMKTALANLKGAAYTAAAPLVEALTPALVALTNAAATAFSYLSRLVSYFTGKSLSSMASAAKKVQTSANTAKKAMASLAGFDEIQRLGDNSGGSGNEDGTTEPNYEFQGQSSFFDSVLESIKTGQWSQVGALVAQKLNDSLARIQWPGIQEKARTWTQNIVDTLNGFISTLDWEQMGNTVSNGLVTIFTTIGDFFAGLDWQGLGDGIASFMGAIDWSGIASSLFGGIGTALGGLGALIWGVIEEEWNSFVEDWLKYTELCGGDAIAGLLTGILLGLVDIGSWIWDNIFVPIWDGICSAFDIHSPSKKMEGIGENIIVGMLNGLVSTWPAITAFFTDAFDVLKDAMTSIWEDGIVPAIKGPVNSIIGFINGMVSGICEGINIIIRAMNKLKWDIPEWVPVLGGKSFGFDLSTITAPQIPMLANGGVITQPTLAMMGEYSGARNNPEIAAPQSVLTETIAAAMEDYVASNIAGHEATVAILREILEAILGIEIGDDVIGQAVARYNRKMAVVRGGT